MADLSRLELFEQLTYWIGASSRVDVRIEAGLKRLWSALCGGGPAMALCPRDARALTDQCTKMLVVAKLPPGLEGAASDLLSRSAQSRGVRNRSVHDSWIVEGGTAVGTVSASDAVVARRSVAEFREAVVEATGIAYQLDAVANLVVAETQGIDRMDHPRYHEYYLAVLSGDFDPRDDGGINVPERFVDVADQVDSPGLFGAH